MAKTYGSINDAGAAGNAFAKMMGEWPLFAFNYEAIADGQRRNWAVLIEANKLWNETAQSLATRQMELARQAMQDFAELVEETVRKPGAFEDQLGKSAVCTRHALEGICDIADHATKSSAEVMKLLNKRVSETLDDARTYAKRMPHTGPGSAHVAAAE
ncbi:MAG TPA: phasin family protein [Stellaceae bacterium]|nr:phasin family protein [Stellaceae bacterium]